MANNAPERLDDDEIDLFELLGTLWKGRWTIVAITTLCAVGGVAYALLAVEWWRSDVVMVQTDSRSISGGLAQLGGLANIAGINIGAAGGASQMPVAVLKSKDFAREFIEDKKLLTVLLVDQWDAAAGRWKQADPKKRPDIRDAVRLFDEQVRSVTEDKKTGLLTLSITWKDSAVSAEWANELVKRANDRLRKQALAESERNIKYLQAEIAATNVAALQQSIGKVLESEMQKLLLARGSEEFAFKVIDRAVEPKRRVKPQRAMVVLLSVFAGGLMSVVLTLIRSRIISRGQQH